MQDDLKTIVIGWDTDNEKPGYKQFQQSLKQLFISMSPAGFHTDENHIHFISSKEQLDEIISGGGIDIVLSKEELGSDTVGVGSIRKWKRDSRNIKVLLVLSNDRYAKGKVKGLYDNGFYDCIFAKDFNGKTVFELVFKDRSKNSAFSYYGLDEYIDPMDKQKGTRVTENEKKTVKKKEKPSESDKPKDKAKDKPKKAAESEKTGEKDTKVKNNDREKVSENEPHITKKDRSAEKSADLKASETEISTFKDVEVVSVKEAEDAVVIDDGLIKEKDIVDMKDAGEDDKADKPADERVFPVSELKTSVRPEKKELEIKSKKGSTVKLSEQKKKNKEEELVDNSDTAVYISDDNSREIAKIASIKKKAFDDIELNFLNNPDEVNKYLSEVTDESFYVEPVDNSLSLEDKVQEELLRYYTMENSTWMLNLENGIASKHEFEAELMQRINTYDILNDNQKERVFDDFCRFMWGYDIIEQYIENESITDIKILAPNAIQIKKNGRKIDTKKSFRSPEHYRTFINHIARKNHVNLRENAMQRFADNESSQVHRLRLNINTEYVNSSGYPSLHIRMMSKHKYSIWNLIEAGMMSKRTAAYLIHAAQNDTGMVFVGQGSAGKTSLMNTLVEYIPKDMSGICIQEIDELFSTTHKFIQFQQTTGDEDGGREYSLYDLSRNALLTDVDYFIIGEIKGKEAAGFTNAVYTGNRCWASVHGPSSQDALPRIADCAIRGVDYTREELLQMLTSLQVVVFLDHFRIKEISEVVGWDDINKRIVYKRIPLDDVTDTPVAS